MKILSKQVLFLAAALFGAGGILFAATQVVEDPCGTTAIYNKPVPNSEFKIGDNVNFAGKFRVTSCGNGLFFNRATFYIAEDKDIPVTTTSPAVYNSCFGATSSVYGNDCSSIERGDQVQVLDLSKGDKVRKLGTIYPADVSKYDGDGGYNWIEFKKNFAIPADLGFDGDVRFYVEYSGSHWAGHWHWVIAYQKGRIVPLPSAKIECNHSQCGASSACLPTARAYEPIAKPASCYYVLKNKSGVTNLKKTIWYIKPAGAADSQYEEKLSCPFLCDYVLQNDLSAGNTYTVKLEVEDIYGQQDSAAMNIYLAREIRADFKCSITASDPVWRDCQELSEKIAKGGKIYLKDFSQPSEGAAINSWQWLMNETVIGGEGTAQFNAENANRIKLTVKDTAGRVDYKEILLNAKLMPKWEEISPN